MADQKITQFTADTAPTTDDLIVTVNDPAGTPANKKVSIASLFGLLYPIGSIYTSTLSTNPATLLGVGTWVAYGQGQVLVGKAAAGTFSTAGATGGAESQTSDTGTAGVVLAGANGSARFVWNQSDGFHTHVTSVLQPYVVVYMWQRTA